jgi:predicted tellurium resistance membrane protein TerC
MAAAGLPAERRRRIIALGIAAATVLRIFFAYFAVQLLAVIGLTLAGGVLLLWVSWKMYREIRETHTNDQAEFRGVECSGTRVPAHRTTPTEALTRIVLADVSMSLDNVPGLPAIISGYWRSGSCFP